MRIALLLLAALAAGDLDAHIRALGSKSLAERDRAADAIAALGPAGAPAVPALVAWLEEFAKDYSFRPDRALAALAAIGPAARDAIPAVERIMRLDPGPPPPEGEEYRDFHAPAGEALAAMGEPGRAALLRALRDPNPFAGLSAIDGLRTLGADAAFAVPDLADAVHKVLPRHVARMHWDPQQGAIEPLHREAVALLGELGPAAKAAVPALLARREPDSLLALSRIAPDEPEVAKVFGPIVRDGPNSFIERAADAIPAFGAAFVLDLHERLKEGRWGAAIPVAILVAIGEPARAALRSLVSESSRPAWILDALVEAGADTAPYVPTAIALLFDDDPNAWVPAARALDRAGDAAVEAVLPRVLDLAWHAHPWPLLCREAPELVNRLAPAWWAHRRPSPDDGGFDERGLRRTPVLGGGGGGAFEDLGPDGAPLLGFRTSVFWHAGHLCVKRVVPLVRGGEGPASGRDGRSQQEDVAPEGYAVGALLVKAGDRVDGFAVVYFRYLGDRVDPDDVRIGPWRGGTDGCPETVLGGDGNRIVGIHGRRGADVDAIGLVESR